MKRLAAVVAMPTASMRADLVDFYRHGIVDTMQSSFPGAAGPAFWSLENSKSKFRTLGNAEHVLTYGVTAMAFEVLRGGHGSVADGLDKPGCGQDAVLALQRPRPVVNASATPAELAALARKPAPAEMEAAKKHIAGNADRKLAMEDIGWALLNSKEFLFQH